MILLGEADIYVPRPPSFFAVVPRVACFAAVNQSVMVGCWDLACPAGQGQPAKDSL